MKEAERKKILFFVRHGQTPFNKEKKCQGWFNIELNDYGRRQSKCCAATLRSAIIQNNLNIKHIYASPQLRARETAEIIGKSLSLDVIEEPLLKEINHGEWEGLTDKEIEKSYPALWRQFKRGDRTKIKFPGGESVAHQTFRRAKKGIIEIVKKEKENDILIVGHGGSGVLAIIGLLGWPIETFNSFEFLQNTDIIPIVKKNGRWRIKIGKWSPHLVILEGFEI